MRIAVAILPGLFAAACFANGGTPPDGGPTLPDGGPLAGLSLTAVRYPTGTPGISDLEVLDVDGDGDLDLVAAYGQYGRKVEAWRNDGAGALSSPIPFIDAQAVNLDGGDLEGDGDRDLVLSNAPGLAGVYRNDGGGAFVLIAEVDGPNMFFGDVDADGLADLLSIRSSDVHVHHNLGGTFDTPVVDTLEYDLRDLRIADLDGDGCDDLVGARSPGEPAGVLFYLASCEGDYADPEVWDMPVAPVRLRVGDLDGDGDPDLALAVGFAVPTLELVYLEGAAPAGTLALEVPWNATSAQIPSILSGDLNLDGAADILVSNDDQGVRILPYLGADFRLLPAIPTGNHAPGFWGIAELNGDGLPDVAAYAEEEIQLLLSTP